MRNIVIICLLGISLQAIQATKTDKEFDKPSYKHPYQKAITGSVVQYLNDDLSAYPHLKDDTLRQQEMYTQSHPCAEAYRAHWPRCVQGEICATFEDGTQAYSLGTLVGAYHVIAEAYTICSGMMFKKEKVSKLSQSPFEWSTKVTFTPMVEQIEPAQALVLMIPKNLAKDCRYNIGMIILDRPVGRELGWFGITNVSDTDLWHQNIWSFNHPLHSDQSEYQVKVEQVQQEYFEHNLDFTRKQSGGALWMKDSSTSCNNYQIVGITDHVEIVGSYFFENGTQSSGTGAERLAEQKVRWIQNWLQQPYNNAHRESLQYFKQVKLDRKKDPNNLALMLELAHLYRKGKGVTQDYDKMFSFYISVDTDVDSDDSNSKIIASYYLGKYYSSRINRFLPKYNDAHHFFKKSATHGYAKAQFRLGNMYRQGQHVSQNDIKAFKWYYKAAIQGHREAQFNIGNIYHHGIGVNVSYGDAILWYFGAAVQKHPVAQYRLGQMYNQGQGVQPNAAEAIKWYTFSAKQGHADAQLIIRGRDQPETEAA